MKCPRCAGEMIEKEQPYVKYGVNGKEVAKEKQKVWYCRDCMCTAVIKK